MADDKQKQGGKVEGEGSYSATRAYNEGVKRTVESGKVEGAARDAAKAVQGKEAEELRQAEAEGKRHSHGEDPQLKR